VKLHLHRLVDLEYVLVHRAPRGQGVTYELLYAASEHADRTPDAVIVSGLRRVETLTYDAERSESDGARSGAGRPSVGTRSGGGRTGETGEIARADSELVSTASVRAATQKNGTPRRRDRTVVEADA
jgi:hypothetical protein